MSPVLEHMTFEDLSELYRVEMAGRAVSPVRKDLFRAMADLLTRVRGEYEKQLALDPDSVMCEGAEHRKRSAERLCRDVVNIRALKICNMAFLGASGSKASLDALTEEEKTYYYKIVEASRAHLGEMDRIRGKRTTVATHIDEIPARDLPRTAPPVQEEPVIEPEEPPAEELPPEEAPAEEPPMEEFAPEEPPMEEPPAVPEAPAPKEEGIPEQFRDEGEFGPEDDMPDPEDAVPDEALEECMEEPPAERIQMPPEMPEEDVSLRPVLIVVLEDLPEFAGPMRDYRLSKQDVVTMPKVMADALIGSGKAAAVDPSP